ncbi:MAG: FAD:protein FMN transferase [Prevotella sp.]|nr:FAD:protein FMN transferase [Prevotella sp.]
MSRKLIWQIPLLLFLIAGTIFIARQERTKPYQRNQGKIFGTFYHITYQCENDLQKEIENELMKVDKTLSMFNDSSIISRINRNEQTDPTTEEGNMFMEVFHLAMNISKETKGAFDITVAPLVNAWGFGFKEGTEPTPSVVDSIRKFVGYEKVELTENPKLKIRKTDPRTMMDCSAIAKGFGCDVVARFLQKRDVSNYMIEIGGEVVAKGTNDKGEQWRIGITKPTEDSTNQNTELQGILRLPTTSKHLQALATSGNYRNFYYKDGQRYAHTIDPRTGMPVQHNILSATVVAKTCAIADAYATAFMVMGLDGAKKVLEAHDDLQAYLIYSDEKGEYAIWKSKELMVEE